MRLIDADNVVALVRDARKNLPKDSSDFFTRDNMLLNFEQILNLEPTVDTMGSDVLKSVKEIGGYTPDEMIAMYNDYERMAKELEAYEDTGLTPEVCAEYKKFEDEVIASGMTFGEMVELMHAEKDGRLVELPPVKGADIDNPLEPLKVYSALKSEVMKYECRAEHEPQKINVLDYTIIKALQDVLTRAEAENALGKEQNDG